MQFKILINVDEFRWNLLFYYEANKFAFFASL